MLLSYRAVNFQTGVPIPGALVSVYLSGTTTFAVVSDTNGAPLPNPMTADSNALVTFVIDPADTYEVVVSNGIYVSPRYVIGDSANVAVADDATIALMTMVVQAEQTARLSAIDAERLARIAGDLEGNLPPILLPRPGEATTNFTDHRVTAGASAPQIDVNDVVFSNLGAAVRMTGPSFIIERWWNPLEAGVLYTASFSFSRHADSTTSPPVAIRWGISFARADRSLISSTVVGEMVSHDTLDGQIVSTVGFSLAAQAGSTIIAPALSVYARVYVDVLDAGVEDVLILSVTKAAVADPATSVSYSGLSGRVTTLEGANADTRITALESAVSGPKRLVLSVSSTSIAATTVGASVQIIETLGYYAVNDGGGALWRRCAVTHVGAKQSLDGQWWEVYASPRGTLTPLEFGAKGSNTDGDETFNQPAFDCLELMFSGAEIDLLGMVYRVTTNPRKARYRNGGFRDSSSTTMRPPRLPAHPLDARVRAAIREDNTHLWNGPILWDPVRRRWGMLFTRSQHHGNSPGATLHYAWSYDCFLSIAWEETVMTVQTLEFNAAFSAGGMMDSGRIGFVILARDVSDNYTWYFIYSDTGGAPWSYVNITGYVTATFVPLGSMLRTPAGTPGQFVVFGAGGTDEGASLVSLTTLDNGSTWSQLVCVNVPMGESGVEWYVEQVAGGYVGIARNGNATDLLPGNALATTSVDLVTWTPIVDSGLPLGSQPPTLIADDGMLYVLSQMRGGAFGGPGYGTPVGGENRFVLAMAPEKEILASGGVWPSKKFIDAGTSPHRATGSMYYTRDPFGGIVVSLCAQEELSVNADPAARQTIFVCSRGISIDPTPKPRRPNLLHNQSFRARNFDSRTITSGLLTDRFEWGVAVSVAVNFVTPTLPIRKLLPLRTSTGMSLASAGAPYANLRQTVYGKDAVSALCNVPIAVMIEMSGVRPTDLVCQLIITSDGVTSVGSTSKALAPPSYLNGLETHRLVLPPVEYDVSGLAANARGYFSIKSGATGGAWAATFYHCQAEQGTDWSDPVLVDPSVENDILDMYSELVTIPQDTMIGLAVSPALDVAYLDFRYKKKIIKPPTVPILISPLAGDFVGAIDTGSPLTSDSSSQFFKHGMSNARLRLAGTAMAAGSVAEFYAARTKQVFITTGM